MRAYLVIFFVILISILSSCTIVKPFVPNMISSDASTFSDYTHLSHSDQSDLLLEQILTALEDKDTDSLKSLFALTVTTSVLRFDGDMEELMDFYRGELVEYKRYGPGSHAVKESGIHTKEIYVSYDIVTTQGEYRLAFLFCVANSEDATCLGLHSLYIVEAKCSDMKYAYWGGEDWLPGINID